MILPPDVSEMSFRQALQEFARVVGDRWVLHRDEDVATYRDAYSPFAMEPDKQLEASAAVVPTSTEQVQQIVRNANKYRIPLYTDSTGLNRWYGGWAPSLSGSVIVDLKRMNRIIEVNTREGYMIVEPGVSFIELDRHLVENKIDYV